MTIVAVTRSLAFSCWKSISFPSRGSASQLAASCSVKSLNVLDLREDARCHRPHDLALPLP